MDISFIIPAYNEEKYLSRCIESILFELRRYPHLSWEIIVVNNASTDKTGEIARSYKEVTTIDEPKKGLVSARQAGAAAAKGLLQAHIDADNIVPKGWMQIVQEEFSQDPELVALSGPLIYYELPKAERSVIKAYYGLGLAMHWFNQHVLHIGSLIQGGNFVVRNWAWAKMEKISPDFSFYGEDTILAKNLMKLGKVKFTFDLPIYSSSRRLKREGIIPTALHYVSNFFSVTLFKRPATKKYKDIRQ